MSGRLAAATDIPTIANDAVPGRMAVFNALASTAAAQTIASFQMSGGFSNIFERVAVLEASPG